MLLIEDLQVELAEKTILKHIDLEIKPGETHALFGPNGSGKTSLLMTIMGYPQYKVTGGKIVFKGVDVTHSPINERAELGIGMSYQRPPTINGLKTRQMVEICSKDKKVNVEALAEAVNFNSFLERDINAGFSGGEIKRSELLQLTAQKPDLLMLDEPESGVDIENIALVGEAANRILLRGQTDGQEGSMRKQRTERTKSGLIITHTGHILQYVPADVAHVMYKGTLSCSGNAQEMLQCIQHKGYEECIRCAI